MYKQYKRKKLLYPKKVALYKIKNNIDLYFILFHLLLLTNAKELLIVYVYMLIQYCQIQEYQFKYLGHIVNFI